MANVKRTFSLPNEISEELDQTIPNKERSKFLAQSLRSALKEHKRTELLNILKSSTPQAIPEGKKSIVDALGDIRISQYKELESN
ncbi:MAG: hypothetical protein JKY08_07565 [Flavobacteriaceae bacterium]|nr:hypothetical protein [Flavobacteriaceae bacterium]